MTDSENLTALLMAGAGDCFGKGGALNCSKLADYLLDHGVIVPPCGRVNTIAEHTDIWNLPKTISAKPSFSPVKKRKKR